MRIRALHVTSLLYWYYVPLHRTIRTPSIVTSMLNAHPLFSTPTEIYRTTVKSGVLNKESVSITAWIPLNHNRRELHIYSRSVCYSRRQDRQHLVDGLLAPPCCE